MAVVFVVSVTNRWGGAQLLCDGHEGKNSPDEKYEQVPHFVLKLPVSRQAKRGTCVRDVKLSAHKLLRSGRGVAGSGTAGKGMAQCGP